ncbi:metallophosphoesterase [Thermosipho sp. 1074]|uniref:metallophosphoesterase n=1 Tax=Thermosipho sp. 1074 TaxID=1643331 RepID=UPI000987D56D|nr:metallophosphoesterase [Thermosipho sp. 1074]OOC42197.1 DNA repair exonuclease [Thermosipho sp. 1074]
MPSLVAKNYIFQEEIVQILAIGDLHLGSEGSNYQKIFSKVREFKDAKIILMGDLLDNAIIGSVGNVYEQVENPQGALRILFNFLEENKKRILGILRGNHERRTWKVAGVDPIELFAETLEIPYSRDFLFLDISLSPEGRSLRGLKNRTNYLVVCHHGITGGRFREKSMRQHRYFQGVFASADIYITGHTHIPDMHQVGIWEYDKRNKKIFKRKIWNVIVPAWTDEAYAKEHMLGPNPETIILLNLYAGKTKKIKGIML